MQIQAYTHSCIQHFIQLNTNTGTKRMKNLTESFKSNGLVPRTHGNTRRLPKHTLSYETQKSVVTFLFNFSSQNSLVLPGRVPGFSKTDIRLLPSSLSKRAIWRQYKEAMESVGDQSVAYTTFCRLWQTLVPYLVVMKPMTDLCWQCQRNSAALSRTANNHWLRRQQQSGHTWSTLSLSRRKDRTTRPSVTLARSLSRTT